MSAKSWVQLLTLSLLWGVSYLIVEVALSGLPARTVALCHVALAAFPCGLASAWGGRFRRLGGAPLTSAFGQVVASSVFVVAIWRLADRPCVIADPSLRAGLISLGLAAIDGRVFHRVQA